VSSHSTKEREKKDLQTLCRTHGKGHHAGETVGDGDNEGVKRSGGEESATKVGYRKKGFRSPSRQDSPSNDRGGVRPLRGSGSGAFGREKSRGGRRKHQHNNYFGKEAWEGVYKDCRCKGQKKKREKENLLRAGGEGGVPFVGEGKA